VKEAIYLASLTPANNGNPDQFVLYQLWVYHETRCLGRLKRLCTGGS